MSAARPIAEFRAVSKSYDGATQVLRGLSFATARGEFLTLLGPSGAGKTSCLLLLAGHVRPDAGEILLRGQLVNRTPPGRRGVGMVPQSDTVLGHRSVAENVALGLGGERLGRAERAARVSRVLDLTRLSGLADRLPVRLSAGQRQRIPLARALLHTPDLLLMDEPLGSLDPLLRVELLAVVRAIHRQAGIGVLYVTHDQAEALAVSDRIGVLHRGGLRQLARPETVYEEPADAFVAGFVGANNLLPGTVEAIEDDLARVRLHAGPVVAAQVATATRGGDACVVAIRPERVALAAVAAREMGEDALSAVVLDITYHGDHRRIRLALGGETELVVKRPSAAGLAGLAVGQPAAVAWQPGHARAFLLET